MARELRVGTQTVRIAQRRLTPADLRARVTELEQEKAVLEEKVEQARDMYAAFNAAVCALLKDKFHGRAFASVNAFAETQGWTVDVLPQKALGNIQFTCLDGNGDPQFEDQQAGPNDVKCTFENCKSKAVFAEGTDEKGVAINPRCSLHLPVNALVHSDKPIDAVLAEEPEVQGCSDCGRKVGHNRDCKYSDIVPGMTVVN